MKKLFLIAILLLAAGSLFGQALQKGNLIGLHIAFLQFNPGVTEEDAVKFILEKYLPEDEKVFGTKDYLLHGVRGEYAGKYALMVVFKDEEARDKFYASNDEAAENLKKANALMKNLSDEADKLWTTTTNEQVYTDYLVVVSKGEPIHKGSLIGVHNLTLKLNDNATEEQFVDYHTKYMESAYEDLEPGMKVSVSKSIRGISQGKLAYFVIFDSEDKRNEYFDKDGKPTQKKLELDKAMQTHSEKLSKIGTTETTYTDWIVL